MRTAISSAGIARPALGGRDSGIVPVITGKRSSLLPLSMPPRPTSRVAERGDRDAAKHAPVRPGGNGRRRLGLGVHLSAAFRRAKSREAAAISGSHRRARFQPRTAQCGKAPARADRSNSQRNRQTTRQVGLPVNKNYPGRAELVETKIFHHQRHPCRGGFSGRASGECRAVNCAWIRFCRRRRLSALSRTNLEGVKSVSMALQQAERYGTPMAQTLRVMAQENRDMRMSEAEKKAAALPPKLTVPMILFFLPVLFIVILGPAAIRVIDMNLMK